MDNPWSSVPRLLHLAHTYRAAGNVRSALAALEDALIEAPDNPDVLVIYARTLLDADRVEDAEAALTAARQIDPEDPDGMIVKAFIHIRRNEFGMAQTMCDQALELDAEMADAHFIRGLVLQGYYQTEAAEAAFTKALSLEPGAALVAVQLARLKLDRGDKEGAHAILTEMDDAGKVHPEYILMMGEQAFDAGNLDEAFDRAIWVLQNEPDDADAVLLLSKVKFARAGWRGWPMRASFWFDSLSGWVRAVIWIAGILIFVSAAARWRAGDRDPILLVKILGLMGIVVFAMLRGYLLDYVVQRELRAVKLKDF